MLQVYNGMLKGGAFKNKEIYEMSNKISLILEGLYQDRIIESVELPKGLSQEDAKSLNIICKAVDKESEHTIEKHVFDSCYSVLLKGCLGKSNKRMETSIEKYMDKNRDKFSGIEFRFVTKDTFEGRTVAVFKVTK